MNVYDFDGTIYNGDSTIDFYLYCLKKRPKILKALPRQLLGMAKYILMRIDKTMYKEYFFSFLFYLTDTETLLNQFCSENLWKIATWYRMQQRDDDVIISASPRFLVERFCKEESIKYVIASDVDKNTGKFLGSNCKGKEKVKRFRECFGNAVIDKFYFDSKSDFPLVDLAKESYIIQRDHMKRIIKN